MASSKSPIFVTIRVRPFLAREVPQTRCVDVTHASEGAMISLSINGSKSEFRVDAAFDDSCDQVHLGKKAQQERMYNVVGSRLVERAVQGYHVAVFAYGHTGTGKTTTMLGEPSAEGLAPRLLTDLFANMNRLETPGCQVNFRVRMYEIHNERLKDLLAPVQQVHEQQKHIPVLAGSKAVSDASSATALSIPVLLRSRAGSETLSTSEETSATWQLRQTLDVHAHPKFGVYVPGLSDVPVASAEEACNLLRLGAAARETASTALNAQSSRGHVIFTVTVEERADQQSRIVSELSLADLAGRENEKTTAVTGERLVELSFINRSLFHLSNCINGLHRSSNCGRGCSSSRQGRRGCSSPKQACQGNGPSSNMAQFRNSKLTLLLSQAISGNSCTAMVGTLSPALCSRDETFRTLQFATAVRGIRLEASMSAQIRSVDQTAALQKEIQELNGQLQSCKAQAEARVARELLASQTLCARLQRQSDECNQAAAKAEAERAELIKRLEEVQQSNDAKPAKAMVQDANLLLSLCKRRAGMSFGIAEMPCSNAPAGAFQTQIFVQLLVADCEARAGSPPKVLHVWTVEEFAALREQMRSEAKGAAQPRLEQFKCLKQHYVTDEVLKFRARSSSNVSTAAPSTAPSSAPSSAPSRAPSAPSSAPPSPLISSRSVQAFQNHRTHIEVSRAFQEEVKDFQVQNALLCAASVLRDNKLLKGELDALMQAVRALNEGDAVLLLPASQSQ